MKTHIRDLAYAAPMSAVVFFASPAVSVLQPLYAKYFGVSLTAIAVIVLAGRIVDAVTDPLIGHVSDRLTQKHGSPALLLFTGAVLLGVCGYFLFIPLGYDPSADGAYVSAVYFAYWYIAYVIAETMIEVPHAAWGGALASSAKHKTRIYTYRAAFAGIGGLGFYFIPYLYGGESREITPETLSAATIAYFVSAPLLFYLFYAFVYRRNDTRTGNQSGSKPGLSFLSIYRTVIENKPYRVLTVAHVCSAASTAIHGAILFFFVDAYLGQGEKFALLFIVGFGVGMSSYPVWYLIASKWGRRFAWVLAHSVTILGYIGLATVEPGQDAWIPLLVFSTLTKVGGVAVLPFLMSFLSEVSDYGSLKFKSDTPSAYFAAFMFINKVLGALAISVAYTIIGWFGFDPTASVQSESAIVGLEIMFIWIPVLCLLISAVFAANIPIDERRYSIIKRRLDLRAARLSQTSDN